MVKKNGAKGDEDTHAYAKANTKNREEQLENEQDMNTDDIPVDELERDLKDDRKKHHTKQDSDTDPEK